MTWHTVESGSTEPLSQNVVGRRWASVPIGWFVLVLVAGGFLSFVQDLLIGKSFPIEIASRALILLNFILVFIFFPRQSGALPSYLSISLFLSGASMMVLSALSLISDADFETILRTIFFMYGVAFVPVLAAFVPVSLTRGLIFPVFFLLCICFGALQVYMQDLIISEALKLNFGVQFEAFANGSIRAISFFASAPRFAEVLVFVSLILLFDLVSKRKSQVVRLFLYILVLWLLYNTFSRSGYVLLLSATFTMIFIARVYFFSVRSVKGFILRAVCITGAGVICVWVMSLEDLSVIAVSDAASTIARLAAWHNVISEFQSANLNSIIFGTGRAPIFSRSEIGYYAIDNFPLIILQFGGLVGLFGFLVSYWAVFVAGLVATRSGDKLLFPVMAFYLGLFFESMFVDNHNTIYLMQIVVISLIYESRKRYYSGNG